MSATTTRDITDPDLAPEAQEWLARIREVEAANFAQRRDGSLSDAAFCAAVQAVSKAYQAWEAALPRPHDCPAWCNAHGFTANSDEVTSSHVHEVKVGGAMLSIDEDRLSGGVEGDIYGACNMTLEQLRAFGVALVAACDAVQTS